MCIPIYTYRDNTISSDIVNNSYYIVFILYNIYILTSAALVVLHTYYLLQSKRRNVAYIPKRMY